MLISSIEYSFGIDSMVERVVYSFAELTAISEQIHVDRASCMNLATAVHPAYLDGDTITLQMTVHLLASTWTPTCSLLPGPWAQYKIFATLACGHMLEPGCHKS